MVEDVDVSALAELVRIRRDEDLLRERLERMEAKKDAVSEVVYRRVRSDYETRRGTLDTEAHAPRERAAREYVKVRGLVSEAAGSLEDARLAREEVDFRHDLGEFTDEEFAARRREADQLLSERQARVDELIRVKQRFIEAFPSEDELDRAAGLERSPVPAPRHVPPAPAPPPPDPEPATAPGTLKAALHELATPVTTAPTKPAHVPPPPVPVPALSPRFPIPPPPPYSPDATVAGPPPERSPAFSAEATALAAVADAPPREPVEHRSATVSMNVARILVVQEDGQGPEYVLRPEPNSVGRAPDSVIRLPYPDVSRQHATVFPVDGGWKIVDRGSPNGLFVNGNRVKEHVLADGDVIQVGRRKLLFRT